MNAENNKASQTTGDFEGGYRWVRITGLQSEVGQKLNGKVGQMLKEEANEEGRHPIKVDCVKLIVLSRRPKA